jgi:hypothetical protein
VVRFDIFLRFDSILGKVNTRQKRNVEGEMEGENWVGMDSTTHQVIE